MDGLDRIAPGCMYVQLVKALVQEDERRNKNQVDGMGTKTDHRAAASCASAKLLQ